MKILHGTWIPQAGGEFIKNGAFYLWVETTERRRFRQPSQRHPRQLIAADLVALLTDELGIQPSTHGKLEGFISPQYFLLPSVNNQPLPSLELSRYLEAEVPEAFEFQYWQVDCYKTIASVKTGSYGSANVTNVIRLLNDLHFMALHRLADVQIGADLLFWYHYTQALKRIIWKDHYIPALKYRELSAPASNPSRSTRRKTARKPAPQSPNFEIYPGWEFIGEEYETTVREYESYMPLACVSGFTQPQETPEFYDLETLLRHFSESVLSDIVTHTYSTQAFEKQIADSIVYDCLHPTQPGIPWTVAARLEQYQQWQAWRDRIIRTQTDLPFYLCFQLQDPAKPEEAWQLQFQVASKSDPSLRISLLDYWRLRSNRQRELAKHLGPDFEQHLLMNLGYAARIYPRFWQGLETDQPVGIFLDLDAAFEFLQESAAGERKMPDKVIVPAWWTPQGRQRAEIRLKSQRQIVNRGQR